VSCAFGTAWYVFHRDLPGHIHIYSLLDDVREMILNTDALSTIASMLKTPDTIWSGVTSLAFFAEYGPSPHSVALQFCLSQSNLRGRQNHDSSH
jgi:hypothetical protein